MLSHWCIYHSTWYSAHVHHVLQLFFGFCVGGIYFKHCLPLKTRVMKLLMSEDIADAYTSNGKKEGNERIKKHYRVCTSRGRCLPCWPALMAPLYPASTLRLLELYISCLVGSLVWSRIDFLCLFARKNRSAQQYNIAADKITWGGFECFFCICVEISKRKKN